MTRQDFELTAQVLKAQLPRKDRLRVALAFGREFKANNARFDLTRFLRACGLEG